MGHLLTEKIRLKRSILKSPYLVFSLLCTTGVILFMILLSTAAWKGIIGLVGRI